MIIERLVRGVGPTNYLDPDKKSQTDGVKNLEKKIVSGGYRFEKVDCVCGSEADDIVAEVDRFGLPVRTVICKECGLIRSDPYFTDDALFQMYQKEYREIDNALTVGTDGDNLDELFEHERVEMKRIVEIIHAKNKLTAYEIGCGAGGGVWSLKNHGYEAKGCDWGSKCLEYGKEKGLDLRHGGIEVFDEPVDVIAAHQVFEHFKDPLGEGKKIYDRLKKRGLLYLGVPALPEISRTYSGDIQRWLIFSHAWYYSIETLEYVLNRCGFKRVLSLPFGNAFFQKTEVCGEPEVCVEPKREWYLENRKFLECVEYLRTKKESASEWT